MEWKEGGDPFKAGNINVDSGPDQEDGPAAEKDYPGWKNGVSSTGIRKIFQTPDLPYAKMALVLLVVMILAVIFVSFSGSDVDENRIAQLEDRIQALEQQLAESIRNQSADSPAEDPVGALGRRLDGLETATHSRMAQISGQVAAVEKKIEAVKKRLAAPPKAAVSAAKTKPAVRRHTVKSGETLYAIARRYGKTVKQLRQMNRLSAEAKIYPGQRLAVGP